MKDIAAYLQKNMRFSREHEDNKIVLKKSLTMGESSLFQDHTFVNFNGPDFENNLITSLKQIWTSLFYDQFLLERQIVAQKKMKPVDGKVPRIRTYQLHMSISIEEYIDHADYSFEVYNEQEFAIVYIDIGQKMLKFNHQERPFTLIYDKKADKFEIAHFILREHKLCGDGDATQRIDCTKY